MSLSAFANEKSYKNLYILPKNMGKITRKSTHNLKFIV